MIGATYLASGNWNPICLPHLPACGQEIHYPFYFSLSPSSPLKHGARKIDKRNRLLFRRWSRRSKSKLVHSYDDFALKFIVEIILSNTIDRYELFEEKNYFLPDFTIGGERAKRKRLRRGSLVVCQRLEERRTSAGCFAQRGMAGNGLQETLLRCETINERRPRSRWRPFSARVRSMPHYNPLTINELLMKWNGRRCRPHRPTGAPEMGGSLWFPSENGNVLRPDATAHPPFPPLSLSLFGYHRPSRN